MTREHDHYCDHDCGRHYRCEHDRCPGAWTCPICTRDLWDRFICTHFPDDDEQEMPSADIRERKQ